MEKASIPANREGGYDAWVYVDGQKYHLGSAPEKESLRPACGRADLKIFGNAQQASSSSSSNYDVLEDQTTFLEILTREEVFNLIKTGSYYSELRKFFGRLPYELFRKTLTLSDVHIHHRLTIPSKDAQQHFGMKSLEKLQLLDWEENRWIFKYYVANHTKYYLTAGWANFVRAKNLRKDDVVVFFRYLDCSNEKEPEKGFIIGVVKKDRRGSDTGKDTAKIGEEEKRWEKITPKSSGAGAGGGRVKMLTVVVGFDDWKS